MFGCGGTGIRAPIKTDSIVYWMKSEQGDEIRTSLQVQLLPPKPKSIHKGGMTMKTMIINGILAIAFGLTGVTMELYFGVTSAPAFAFMGGLFGVAICWNVLADNS